MSRKQVLKQFFFKSILPFATVFLLYCIFRSACTTDGQVNYLWLWILCGLPIGIHRMFFWISSGGSMANFISQGLAMIVLGGIIGGFVLAWRLVTAIVYIPLTCYRLVIGS